MAMSKIPSVTIHPISHRQLAKGHAWVTEDSFTKRFPKKDFLIATNPQGNPWVTLLHDPTHPKIKARVWKLSPHFNFLKELEERIALGIKKRSALNLNRENYYLSFAEADDLPGLFIQHLGSVILIQYEMLFWKHHLPLIETILKKHFHAKEYWTQFRQNSKSKESLACYQGAFEKKSFILKEEDISYHLKLGLHYDFGLYTDMAAIRKKCEFLFKPDLEVLNLFSYTGAWSLFALKHQAKHVTSVDLSLEYMQWLEENLKLNIFKGTHTSYVISAADALKRFSKEGKGFDLIICDPPSAFSDGKKITSALSFYQKEFPSLFKLLKPQGHLLLFLNTHHLSMEKFKKTILDHKLKMSIKGDMALSDDCPFKKGFPEGNYLKGILLKKNS